MQKKAPSPAISWENDTGYDLLISLAVLHHPERFGLRPSWAAGVRSRLPAEERKTLELADTLFPVPLQWVHRLSPPRDAAGVLWALRQTPPAERLAALTLYPGIDAQMASVLQRVAERNAWNEADLETLREAYRKDRHESLRPKALAEMLDAWKQPEIFGERYLAALQAYHQVFFSEEERRIIPVLEQGLAAAQHLAGQTSPAQLFEQLTQGVLIPDLLEREELVFVASFWGTPLVFVRKLDERRALLTFGVRPSEASLVPGGLAPDALLQALKAMADPTRLRILRYLAHEPLTPAELARRLRLRAPTVTHHLSALRLAGLVHITLDAGDEKHYAARQESIDGLQKQIKDFLGRPVEDV